MIVKSKTFFHNCRPCYGGLGHYKPQRCNWFWAAPCREDQVFGICSSSLHPVSTVPGSLTFFNLLHIVIFTNYNLWVRVFAYLLFSFVFRWVGPCLESSKPSAGLMGRRSSLSSHLWAMQSFTVTSMDRASWHDLRNLDCESIMAV